MRVQSECVARLQTQLYSGVVVIRTDPVTADTGSLVILFDLLQNSPPSDVLILTFSPQFF